MSKHEQFVETPFNQVNFSTYTRESMYGSIDPYISNHDQWDIIALRSQLAPFVKRNYPNRTLEILSFPKGDKLVTGTRLVKTGTNPYPMSKDKAHKLRLEIDWILSYRPKNVLLLQPDDEMLNYDGVPIPRTWTHEVFPFVRFDRFGEAFLNEDGVSFSPPISPTEYDDPRHWGENGKEWIRRIPHEIIKNLKKFYENGTIICDEKTALTFRLKLVNDDVIIDHPLLETKYQQERFTNARSESEAEIACSTLLATHNRYIDRQLFTSHGLLTTDELVALTTSKISTFKIGLLSYTRHWVTKELSKEKIFNKWMIEGVVIVYTPTINDFLIASSIISYANEMSDLDIEKSERTLEFFIFEESLAGALLSMSIKQYPSIEGSILHIDDRLRPWMFSVYIPKPLDPIPVGSWISKLLNLGLDKLKS